MPNWEEDNLIKLSGSEDETDAIAEQPTLCEEKLKYQPMFIPTGEFAIEHSEILRLMNFDNRAEASQLAMLNSEKYGGVEGLAHSLRTDLKMGLRKKRARNKWQSEVSLMMDAEVAHPGDKFGKALKIGRGSNKSLKDPYLDERMSALIADVRDAALRVDCFGRNFTTPPKAEGILKMLFESIKSDAILKILIAGAVIAFVVGMITDPKNGWIDSFAIIVAVIIVSTVTAGNNYMSEKKFRKLLMLQSSIKVKVVRDGLLDEISSWDLLAGDIVQLATGDEIPADGLYIRGEKMIVDESALTGESLPVHKSADIPYLFSGCHVTEGKGFMLVAAVGTSSTAGKIQEILSKRQKELTPLQEERLEVLAKQISYIGLISSILTFLALAINWSIILSNKVQSGEDIDGLDEFIVVLNFVVISVTILVVTIPEGLPISVTISLGFSMFEMVRENCFVRRLQSSETMGAATCICTDKTGTLTENRMTVVKAVFGDRIYNGQGSGEGNAKEFHTNSLPDELNDIIAENVSINSDCFLKHTEDDDMPIFVGSSTEGALLVFVEKLGNGYQDIRDAIEKVKEGTWQFTSARKMMSTLIYPCVRVPTVAFSQEPLAYTLHVKGAAEVIISKSIYYLDRSGTRVCEMTNSDSARFQDIVKAWASEGLRTLGLAYRATELHPVEESLAPERELILIGLIGIKDPVRSNVPKAVRECQSAGLFVRMVTGDNLLTASRIAKECGILRPGGIAIEATRFRSLSRDNQLKLIPHIHVIARSTPTDKYDLVKLLKASGEVVCVTGDGTNDSPALAEADIGFAMVYLTILT